MSTTYEGGAEMALPGGGDQKLVVRLDEVLSRVSLNRPWTVREFAAWMSDDVGMEIILEPHPIYAQLQAEAQKSPPGRQSWRPGGQRRHSGKRDPAPTKGNRVDREDSAPWLGACGLLLQTWDGRLIIRYDPRRSRRHQRQQIFHEFGHILCDHEGDSSLELTHSPLTDGIDPAIIKAVLHRDYFDTPSEAQAELIGTKLAVYSCGEISDESGRVHRGAAVVESLRQ